MLKAPPPYPTNLSFPNPYYKQFADRLHPQSGAFFEGGILSDDDAGWNNVFAHCLVEAIAADVLAEHLLTDQQTDASVDRPSLVVAAFVHDAYKRIEMEQLRQSPKTLNLLYATDRASSDWLRNLGYPRSVIDLQQGIGNNAALGLYRQTISILPLKVLHYIDDITQEDQLVPLEKRLTALEHNVKYQKQNEWSRRYFDGHTLYEAKRIINGATEQYLADRFGVTPHTSMPSWIAACIADRYHSSNV